MERGELGQMCIVPLVPIGNPSFSGAPLCTVEFLEGAAVVATIAESPGSQDTIEPPGLGTGEQYGESSCDGRGLWHIP